MTKMQDNNETLYGITTFTDNANELWLVTDPTDYDDELIGTYDVSFDVIDQLATKDEAVKYLVEEGDDGEDMLGETDNLDVEKMKEDGYVGYYYDMGDGVLMVCLFDKSMARKIN